MDLSIYADNTFDIALVLGPLYHLYDENDIQKAIRELLGFSSHLLEIIEKL